MEREFVTTASPMAQSRVLLARAGPAISAVAAIGLALMAIGWMVLTLSHSTASELVRDNLRWFVWVLAIGGTVTLFARGPARDASALENLTLRVGSDGVVWSGPVPRSMPWSQIGFVAVVPLPFGQRRLRIVKPGTNFVAQSPFAVLIRHLLQATSHPFLLDVPLSRFDRSADEMVAAIRLATGGRQPVFPVQGVPHE